ncbi:class I SAM-dependent methyltransferase [Nocardia stercoris]|uniref:Class I SAM-dependent methyltransferase n=1 Tax=Nocardia stercoris TaxID=2483361 RepID=A0A3M2KQW9_9NOCA|nr:class I SAM-dependent methyltransferase [Nocardia stercoris]RMI27859.1 class I SAM-dependent methyltransferase [Nocardia stercoris]
MLVGMDHHDHGDHQNAHTHHHHHDDDFDWAAMADHLESEAEAYRPFYEGALDLIEVGAPQRILDVGSGPGFAAVLLAQRFPDAEVIAVDGAPELLERATERAKDAGVRIGTRVAQFPEGLADLPAADLVWVSNAVHHVGDQVGALRALAATLRPGGVLAVAEGGLAPRWLPKELGFGRSGLQERLDAAQAERYARMRDELPGSVIVADDWVALLAEAGLPGAVSRSVLVDRPAPASDIVRRIARANLARFRDMIGADLDSTDQAALDRLLDPADPASVDLRPDLFLLAARTVHLARKV